ncbi:ABC transporter ATP-binding protein [Bacillus marinisedimentorum]|uniref:ABC transporter ATP-binding protein n=1 Tax=Bacillus marinisedimentorum TaxID=1821260 RepID=UPI0007E1F92B|nr:ABC transporter ATP-binding protein [Bacillus marinisedimentorum]
MFKELIKPFQYKKINLANIDAQNQEDAAPLSNKSKRFETLKRIWRFLAVEKGLFLLVLLMVAGSSALALAGPFFVGKAVDDFLVNQDISGLGFMLVLLVAIYLLHSVTLFLQNYWMVGIAQNTVFAMRDKLFRHLHRLPVAFFDKRKHGELMSRVTNDIENVSSTLNSSVIQIFSSLLTLIGTIAVMLWLSPLLTFITILVVPAMFFGLKWITNRTGKLFKEQQRNLGDMNGFIEETISGQCIVKTFSRENEIIEEFKIKNEKLRRSAFWAQAFSGFIPKVMNTLNHLSFALIAAIGGLLAMKGAISIGTIIVFTEYSRQFTRPLNDLANQFNTLLSAIAGADRVFDILDEKEEAKRESEGKEFGEIKGEVRFDDVSFSYEKDDDGDTVTDISFTVSPGETAALVGPTGAGKSTILNLLFRFYDPGSGKILIDGQDISEVKHESVRKQMAFVLQDTFLFEGTIKDNIRFGRLDASDEEIVAAAKQANAHSFIRKLPEGYDTVLKQDGSGISQGQRQLLSIARAILADPAILILDEATSSIDTITELKIQEALDLLMKDRTTFVIAHRLNTIRKADLILFLADGEIVEKGTHEELIGKRGYYAGLHGA